MENQHENQHEDGSNVPPMMLVAGARMVSDEVTTDEKALRKRIDSLDAVRPSAIKADHEAGLR